MGLIKPDQGNIFFNKLNIYENDVVYDWREKIAHVPQNIFLKEDDKKYKILSRNRFERYVMAGGFEEVGKYLAKNYLIDNILFYINTFVC